MSDCEDGNMLEQQLITLIPPEITMACHLTEIIMHQGLTETGDAEE